MITATLTDIGIACRTLMAATIAGRAVILSESDDSDPNARDIFVINAVQPGDVDTGELGGRAGIAVQNGVFLLNLSYIRNDSAIKADAEELAQDLVDAFRRADLNAPSGACVYCKEPYITNVGTTPDDRMSLLVSVPWWAWTGGKK